MILLRFILPNNVRIKVCSLRFHSRSLLINGSTCQSGSYCPLCYKKSVRIHSKYNRELSDLPVSGSTVRIKLVARKYFCDNYSCPRKIFTERFDNEICAYSRRLIRSNNLLCKIALELGGNKGATISQLIGTPVSASTILRIIKKIDVPEKTLTSGIIGVDDWAFKKGNTYGTIIVDLRNNEVIDLLPDRSPDTLANWLKNHPEIQTVSRDRYGPYALAIQQGAPQAIQVADRFHLLMNLGDATKRMFQSKGKIIKEAFNLYNNPPKTELPDKTGHQIEESPPQNVEDVPANINPKRQHKFDKVKELYEKGYTIKAIARSVKSHRHTVKKYINLEKLTKKENRLSTNFDAFRVFLLCKSNTEKTYKDLYHTILSQGFTGGYSQFCNNMNDLYKMNKVISQSSPIKLTPIKTWSTTKLSMMVYKDKNELKDDDRQFLKLLYHKSPEIKLTGKLVESFKNLFQSKEDGLLKCWIDQAINSDSGIKNFAKNLIKDFEAVNNAVITPYSNGQVEGQINRLKNIKRAMYGKASFQLLRKMVLTNTS